ncbi:MAG: glycosyltransferase [Pseudomonadota bacterium]
MTDQISFSITVPIGSYHPFLESCLESLVAQDVPLKIAVFDASGDPRVTELVERYADRIAYRHHGPDEGQADAIAKGWQETHGTVLGWLNADDVLAPDALAIAATFLSSNSEVDVVYGHSLICDDEANIIGYHWNVMEPGDHILSTCSISQPSCFFRREALEAAGGLDRSLHYTMDWDLWIRLHNSGARFELLGDIRSLVLWSEQAKTGGFNKQRRAELKRLLDANPSSKARWNGYVGFASHYFYEYVLPRSVRDWIWRRNISGGRGMFGISVSGDIENKAEFKLFHYSGSPKQQLIVLTPASRDDFEVCINGVVMSSAEPIPGGYSFSIPVPVVAGNTNRVELTNHADSPLHLSGIRFS